MFFLRQIGKFLRGESSGFQLVSACVIAALLAFLPTTNAIGSVLVLLSVLLVLNANLFVTGIAYILFKLLYFSLQGMTFAIGEFLIHGPFEWLVKILANAPFTAWMGFDYYVMFGGIPIALILGFGSGILLATSIAAFHKKMASIEQNKDWFEKKWVKIIAWILLGGIKGKKSYEEMIANRKSSPIRWSGIAVAAVVLIGFFVSFDIYGDRFLTVALKKGLEAANGATVEVESVSLDLGKNSLTLKGFAMVDSNDLNEDLLRAEEITADINGRDFLKRRISMDLVTVSGAYAMVPRETPGEKIGDAEEDAELTEEDILAGIETAQTIGKFIKDADIWKERLKQAKKWLEKLQAAQKKVEGLDPKKLLKNQISERAKLYGYSAVSADHLLEDSPRFLARRIEIEGLESSDIPGGKANIYLENISTQPEVVESAPRIYLVNSTDELSVDIALGSVSAAKTENRIISHYKGIPVEDVSSSLANSSSFAVSEGTVGFSVDGAFDIDNLDLPISIELQDAVINVPDVGETEIAYIESRDLITLYGALDNPRVSVNSGALAQFWKDAGKGAATSLAKNKAASLIDEQLGTGGKEIVDGIGSFFGTLGKSDDSEESQESENIEKSEEKPNEKKSRFGGLFGRNSKDDNEQKETTAQPEEALNTQSIETEEPEETDEKNKKKSRFGGLFGGKKSDDKESDQSSKAKELNLPETIVGYEIRYGRSTYSFGENGQGIWKQGNDSEAITYEFEVSRKEVYIEIEGDAWSNEISLEIEDDELVFSGIEREGKDKNRFSGTFKVQGDVILFED
jgi:uncharacterized protein (TIGR03546 family)